MYSGSPTKISLSPEAASRTDGDVAREGLLISTPVGLWTIMVSPSDKCEPWPDIGDRFQLGWDGNVN